MELQPPQMVAEDVGTVDVCAILNNVVTSDLTVSLFTSEGSGDTGKDVLFIIPT